MKISLRRKCMTVLFAAFLCIFPGGAAMAGESTMPDGWDAPIDPAWASKYVYTEDDPYYKDLNIPTYEWLPSADQPMKAVVVAVHGLTLHGRRYRVLARSLAVNGIGFISMDMRGFGRCKFGDYKKFSTPDDDKTKVNNEKSYESIVALTQMVHQRYPDLKLLVLGESLGCTFAVRLAAEHPDLTTGLVLSAPAIKVNADMYAGKGQVVQGLKAVVLPHHEIDLGKFFADLVSSRKEVQDEMLQDPYITKKLPLGALISVDAFVDKTAKWGKMTNKNLSVLILQGSNDGCVSPEHVTKLMNSMPSDDQSLAWRGNFGHLQLETVFMRAQSVDAIALWMLSHNKESRDKMKNLQQDIVNLGGHISN